MHGPMHGLQGRKEEEGGEGKRVQGEGRKEGWGNFSGGRQQCPGQESKADIHGSPPRLRQNEHEGGEGQTMMKQAPDSSDAVQRYKKTIESCLESSFKRAVTVKGAQCPGK
jgi:hypothetical protein